MMRFFYLILGFSALGLGMVGAVLPILPTTPFVILAAFAFGRSSPALQRWLEANPTFGPMIADWKAHGAIAPRYKTIALAMMVAAFGLSIAYGLSIPVLGAQAVCLLGAAAFVLSRPSGPTATGIKSGLPDGID